MRAIITVVGDDRVGIIARVSNCLADRGVNILDISQTTMQGMFTMIMLVETGSLSKEANLLSDELEAIGAEMGLSIHMQKEDLFHSMHRI